MKIVLIFPNYFRKNFFFAPGAFHLPLGLAMIAAVLRKAGHDVHVIDATAERMNIHEVEKRVAAIEPSIIGITSNIAVSRKAIITARWLKARFKTTRIIFGGPFATIEYNVLLSKKCCDFVVLGEGETTIVDLIDALQNDNPISAIQGIAYVDETSNAVLVTQPGVFIEDLDSLPFPAWDLFPTPRKYFFATRGRNFYPLMTSRGCPYGCINCTQIIHGYKLRYRSIENIIEEIRFIHDKFNMNELFIIDDNFNFDVDRAEKICDAIIGLDFKFHIKFSNGLRADKITPRLVWKLKRAGTYEVALGIESGNQEILDKIGKNLDLNSVRRAITLLKKENIMVDGFFMVGLPFENIHSFIQTKHFALESGIDSASFFKVVPFRGTKLYDEIQASGKFIQTDLEDANFFSFQPPMFELNHLPSELIELAFKDFYSSFFIRKQTLKQLITRLTPNFLRWYINFGFEILVNVFPSKKKGARGIKEKIIQKLTQED